MLCRALALRHEIGVYIHGVPDAQIQQLRLQEEEWKHLQYLVALLAPFFIFTNNLSETSGPTIHQVYSIYDGIFNHLEEAMQQLSQKKAVWKQQIQSALQTAYDKLQHYYSHTYQLDGHIYAVAAILDPSKKMTTFQGESWLNDTAPNGQTWHDFYLQSFQRVFNHYCKLYPDLGHSEESQAYEHDGL